MPARSHEGDAARGVQVGALAYLIWGFLTVYWKQLAGFDAFELIGWRMLCAGAVMAAIVAGRGSRRRILVALRDGSSGRWLLLAAVLLTANWTSYVWAVVNDRVVETALGYFMAPLATMTIGVVLLHEVSSPAQRVAFACAAIAVVILTVSYGRPPWIALLLAGTWSFYGFTKRHVALGAVDGLAAETFVLFVPAVGALVILSRSSGSVVHTASPTDWVFVLGTGVITAVPLMLFASAANSIPFTLLGPLNLIVPVINFGLGWIFYGEPMPADRFVGFAFVWVALAAVMWDRIAHARRAERRPLPA